jgi:hypothetical protein
MKTELERYKAALDLALGSVDSFAGANAGIGVRDEVARILSPPPVYETVEEIVGWVNVYQWKDSGRLFTSCVHGGEETAMCQGAPSGCERISCQPIKVMVKRPKPQPVERSVSGAVVWQRLHGHMVPVNAGPSPFDFSGINEKRGTLTFTWEE